MKKLCQTHIEQIRKSLGIATVGIGVSSFNYKGSDTNKSAQIDLVIDRKDKVTNLCEIKFSSSEFEITKQYEENLINKVETYRNYVKQKHSLMLTMITTYGIKKNKHTTIAQSELTLDDLFS